MKTAILDALEDLALQCIDYVGFANYSDRQRHTERVMKEAFKAAREGKLTKIRWFDNDKI